MRRDSRGYTLLELVIVMGLMAAMALVSVRAFSGPLKRMRQEAGLAELALTVERARVEAIRLGVRVYVGFFKDGEKQSYLLFREMTEEEETMGEGNSPRILDSVRSLPESLACRVALLPQWNGALLRGVHEELSVLVFSPLGLRNVEGERIEIQQGDRSVIASLEFTSQGPVRFVWDLSRQRQ